MLARLQQLIVVTWLLALMGWLAWCGTEGWPGFTWIGLAVLLAGHAAVLGLEMVLMHRVNRDDPAPRARWTQVLQAWWGEVTGATRVFGWRQPFRSNRWPDRPEAAHGRGVLLIHGYVCNRGLWNPWLERLTAEGRPVVAVNLEPVFGSIDDYAVLIEKAVARLEAATGRAPVVVAHSMGGLALRRWWAEPGRLERVHHAITIGTPHAGTWLARWGLSPNARQMRLGSRWLQALQAREPEGLARRMTCFYGHCDNIVFPATTAAYPGAQAIHLPSVAHVHMADHPAPWQELMRRLQD